LRPITRLNGDITQICLDTPLSNSLLEGNQSEESESESMDISEDNSQSNLTNNNQGIIKTKKTAKKKKKLSKKCYSLSEPNPDQIQFRLKKWNTTKFSIPLTFNTNDLIFSLKNDFNTIITNDNTTSESLKKMNFRVIPKLSSRNSQCPICHKKFSNRHFRNFHITYKHVNLDLLAFDYNILSFVDFQIRHETRLNNQLGNDFVQEDRVYLCNKVLTTFTDLQIDCGKYFNDKKESKESEKIPFIVIMAFVFLFIIILICIGYGIFLVNDFSD
jgi:hypothetical protein